MIVPIGPEGDVQNLHIIQKEKGGIQERTVLPVRFVPMTGREGEPGAMD
jgi:protein-L-isoaspartate(D-aspartate) O-methyltransferase